MAKRKALGVGVRGRGAKAKRPARRNGVERGGRRSKFSVGDRVRVKIGAPQAYRGQQGQVVGVEGRARYNVRLEEGITYPLYSWWLEPAAVEPG
jgi:hypothetical protein